MGAVSTRDASVVRGWMIPRGTGSMSAPTTAALRRKISRTLQVPIGYSRRPRAQLSNPDA